MPNINNFHQLLEHSAEKYGTQDAFRIRKGKTYRGINYNELLTDVRDVAAALAKRQLQEKKCAILGENSYQWVLAYLGTVVANAVIVPIDKELTASEIDNILTQSGVELLFCSEDYFDIAQELTFKGEIVAINTSNSTTYSNLETLIEQGRELRVSDVTFGCNETTSDTLSTIVFTSGTTGFSKGVMLSRANLLGNMDSADRLIKLSGRTLSLLPMNHTYEFTLNVLLTIFQGVTICINNGIKNFKANLEIFQPTILIIVPLVAENLLATINQNIENTGKTSQVRIALKISNLLLKCGIDVRRKLFRPIHEALGGELRDMFVGGAFLNPKVAQTLHGFGIRVHIGYGITECSPLVTGNITDRTDIYDSCGLAIPGVEIRIATPDIDGNGEIEVRGESVMMGYYKNQDATAAVLRDGWFATGDLGNIDTHGRLRITGRVKNLIVLNNGKNVYPEELEALITEASPMVKEVVVSSAQSGQNQEVNIIAEVFADPDAPAEAAEKEIIIRQAIEQLNEKLPYFKRIIEVRIRTCEFPKTTTKKIKRY